MSFSFDSNVESKKRLENSLLNVMQEIAGNKKGNFKFFHSYVHTMWWKEYEIGQEKWTQDSSWV